MHFDGAVAPMLEDRIEMGTDVDNPVQPNVPGSDPKDLREKYGGLIRFYGGIDRQQLLPSGDKRAIRGEIKRRARTMGYDGRYLMAPAHIIRADVTPDTVEIVYDAAVNGQ